MTEEQGWNEADYPAPEQPADVWAVLERLAGEIRAAHDTATNAKARTMLAGWAEALEAISACRQCGGTGRLANDMGCNRCAAKGVQSFWDQQRNRTWDKQHGYTPVG